MKFVFYYIMIMAIIGGVIYYKDATKPPPVYSNEHGEKLFQVGDCISRTDELDQSNLETWELPKTPQQYKVMIKGKAKYFTGYIFLGKAVGTNLDFMYAYQYTKVECSPEVKALKLKE